LSDAIIGWICWRIRKNKNTIIVINGSTGSGKTYTGLELARIVAERHNTPFSPEGNVDFSFTGLLHKMRREENKLPGTVFLFEEVGAVGSGSSSRDWQSRANKFFFTFMQTARHKNQILIFTCPNFSALEAGTRKLCHMQFIMTGIDFHRKISYSKPYILQVDPRKEKIYFKYLRYTKDGTQYVVKQFISKLPPAEMLVEYEKMKEKFTSKLEADIIAEETPVEKVKTKVNPEIVYALLGSGHSTRKTSELLGVSVRTIERYRKRQETTENKGFLAFPLVNQGSGNTTAINPSF